MLWASLGYSKESSTYIPSKLYEYIAANKPILGFFPEGEASNLIKSTGTGVVFHKDDYSEIIKIISLENLENIKTIKIKKIKVAVDRVV